MRTIAARAALAMLPALAPILSCDNDTVCQSSDECAANQVCIDTVCRDACNSDLDCRGYDRCVQGVCLPRVDAGAVDSSALDRAPGDASAPDTATGDTSAADRAASERVTADALALDGAGRDRSAPDTTAPDTVELDMAAPDTTAPDMAAPDTAAFDTAAPDTAAPDAAQPPCSATCSGCCYGQTCVTSGFPACGVDGASCISCIALGERVDSCSATQQCVCAASGAPCGESKTCGSYGCCVPDAVGLGTPFDFAPVEGRSMELAPIDGNDALMLYASASAVMAAVLSADPLAGTISMATPSTVGASPSYVYGDLERVDEKHYLAAYNGEGDDGYAVVLEVDAATRTVSGGTPFELDPVRGVHHGLARIDPSRALVVYDGSAAARVAVLMVSVSTNSVFAGPLHTFDTMAESTSVAQVDATHYLAAYRGTGPNGRAVVFEVDLGDNTIAWGDILEVSSTYVIDNTLLQIGPTRFLLAHGDVDLLGQVHMLDVDTQSNSVAVAASHTFGPTQGDRIALAPIDASHALLAYRGDGDDGWVQILTFDVATGAMSSSHDVEYEPVFQRHPQLLQLDPGHFLCTWEGPSAAGWALLIEPPCTLP